jgi:hypothetical protein
MINIEDVKDDQWVLSSFGLVLEINQGEGKWGGGYKPMRDIME